MAHQAAFPARLLARQMKGVPPFDFSTPAGEPALAAPDSVSWRVFKNPIALFIGGITAVLLELAEPRVRSGVWENTSFRTDPLPRMKRTGLAAMVTVYGARSKAEAMIAGVGRLHGRVAGTTPDGTAYRADDPELLDWVQATASYGFMQGYHRFVRPLSQAERDQFYAEAAPSARLYGAVGAPTSEAALEAQFQAMRPKLEPSDIVLEFLNIIARTKAAPFGLGWMQAMLVRAAVSTLPDWTQTLLGLEGRGLRKGEAGLIRTLGRIADRIAISAAPRPRRRCAWAGRRTSCTAERS
ncbi:oxygenase MpaB family protein [Caulobacter sp. 73W]|uniref:Oxygenase MpaB family protein n=1 Tax=Caulobacter sp. 73W TaxID=3161137 RepID=A0AB39KNK1_9CAUL